LFHAAALCALLACALPACGGDSNGEIGDGRGLSAVTTPQLIANMPPSAALYAGGEYGFCSVGTDQSLYCWGAVGMDAHGNSVHLWVPTPMML
jgi:hypothetical protein